MQKPAVQMQKFHLQATWPNMPVPHHSVFLQTGCPSCHPTNSIKALKAYDSPMPVP